MLTIAQSTIATLLYNERQNVDLSTLAQAIESELTPDRVGPCTITWDGDGFVAFDLPAIRISLARIDLAGSGRVGLADCLIIAVGATPDCPGGGPDHAHCDALCASLAEEIDALVPSLRIFTTKAKTIVTSAFLARVVESFGARPAPAVSHIRPRRPTRAQSLSAVRPNRMARLGAPVANPTPGLPALIAPAGLSELETAELSELAELRKSIHDPTVEEVVEARIARTVTRRIAVFSIHTGVILLSGPIGAASLTYAALGRESARAAAHTLALTGILTGLAGAGMAGPVLDILI